MRRSYISVYEAGGRLGTYRSALDKIAGLGKFRNQKGQLQKHSILVIKKSRPALFSGTPDHFQHY